MSKEIRYYRWQWSFSAENEISPVQARSLRSFVRAYLTNGLVGHAETVKSPNEIELVVYYDQVPSDELLHQHRARYGNIRLSVSLPQRRQGEHTETEVYNYNRDGVLIDQVKTLIDGNDLPVREWRYDSSGALYETVEYEYDANGEVGVVRSRAPDGTIIHEDRPPLSD